MASMFSGCFEQQCSFSLNYCKPWQGEECSLLMLRYALDDQQQPVKSSVQCLLLP
jgi:hypothetical protein